MVFRCTSTCQDSGPFQVSLDSLAVGVPLQRSVKVPGASVLYKELGQGIVGMLKLSLCRIL